MNKITAYIRREWRKISLYFVVCAAAFGLLVYRLPSLVGGVSASELAAQNAASSLQQIIDEPVYLPYKLAQLSIIKAGFYGPLAMRLISVVIGLAATILFYYLLRRWFTRRLSLLGSLALVTSSWFLSYARSATPAVLLILTPLVLFHLFLRFFSAKKITLPLLLLLGVTLGLSLYVPGSLYIVVAIILFNWKKTVSALTQNGITSNILLAILISVLLLPLVLASIQNADTMKLLLLLPLNIGSASELLKNVYQVPLQLFVRGPLDPTRNLDRLALLNVAEIAFMVLGFFYAKRSSTTKQLLLISGSIILAVAVIGTSAMSENTALILPILFALVTAGLTFLLQQWLTVFPRNPLARFAGVSLVILVIAISSGYELTRYFIAWPQAPVTRATFRYRM
jgi:hypothetical protein